MHRLALAAAALAALVPSGALAAQPTVRTAQGVVYRIDTHSITVAGRTCRIGTTSPAPSVLRGFHPGDPVKITCRNGVLRTIVTLAPGLVLTTSLTANGGTDIVAVPGTGGQMSVTVLTGTSITATGGGVKVTCAIGSGSPDLSVVHVGTLLAGMRCTDGLVTAVTPA
jgi:hypothetical protein